MRLKGERTSDIGEWDHLKGNETRGKRMDGIWNSWDGEKKQQKIPRNRTDLTDFVD